MTLSVSVVYSLSLISYIPLRGYNTVCLSSYQSTGICAVSNLGLLLIRLLGKFLYKYFLHPLSQCLGLELLGYRLSVCLTLVNQFF